MQILSWFLNRKPRKTIIVAGRKRRVRIEKMEAGSQSVEFEVVDAKTVDEAWDAMDQGYAASIPRKLAPAMMIDDELTPEESVDAILSDQMWAEEEKRRIIEAATRVHGLVSGAAKEARA